MTEDLKIPPKSVIKVSIGCTALITTDNWFIAPDGHQYRAAFGTVKAIHSDKATLGIETNNKSSNWYVEIGNMFIAGCQIHYVIKTPEVSFAVAVREIEHEGKLHFVKERTSRIYNANGSLDV